MRFVFGVGIGFDREGNALGDTAQLVILAKIRACDTFGGCSITRVEGSWKNNAGVVVNEQGLAITVYVDTRKTAGRVKTRIDAIEYAKWLRTAFNQSSVMLSESDATVTFVKA